MNSPTQTPDDCLTLEELQAWADDHALAAERLEHLNVCRLCQAMGEQMHTLDPQASARRVVQAMPDSMSKSARPKGLRARARPTDWAALGAVIALIVIALGLWRYASGETKALAFETRRTRFLEQELAVQAQQVQQLNDQLEALHQPVNALQKTESLSVAAKGLVNKIDAALGHRTKKPVKVVQLTNEEKIDRLALTRREGRIATASLDSCDGSGFPKVAGIIKDDQAVSFVFDQTTSNAALYQALCQTRLALGSSAMMTVTSLVANN